MYYTLKAFHKFAKEQSKMIVNIIAIDKKNGNTFWKENIGKAKKNVKIAL